MNGYRVLFDTGAREETVLRNAEELKVDLTDISDVVLSHNHGDHTGGLLKLRRALSSGNPRALSRAHVATGIFAPRRYEGSGDSEGNRMLEVRDAYEATGARILEHPKAEMLAPGVWLTGPVVRRYPLGAHCTGLEAVYRLRVLLGLDRGTAVVGAVGSSYSSATGLDPLRLAR